MSELDLTDRYGKKPMRWKSLAAILLLLGGSWLTWAGLHHSRPAISTTLISFSISSDRYLSIRYSVDRREAQKPIICTLTAHDFDKNVVGEIDDVIPAGGSHIEKIALIPTRSAAVSAGISRCRPTTQ